MGKLLCEMMKKALFYTAALLLCTSSALADTRIPGSKVSYNSKGVYVDERYDTIGKTYLAILCQNGAPEISIFSKNALASEQASPHIDVQWTRDSEYLGTSDGTVRRNRQSGQLSVWTMDRSYTAALFLEMHSAKSSLSATVFRGGLSPVTFTFPTKGIHTALQAVDYCR